MTTFNCENSEKAMQITLRKLAEFKQQGRKIACLTAYDASFAALEDQAGIDVVLVGDSLGMVFQGGENTVQVTMDDMIYHTRAVSSGCQRALLMVDMPFMSYYSRKQALANAARLMQEGGAHMVKLETARNQIHIVQSLVDAAIPVCAHLGLKPQSVHKLGGYRVQGKEQADAEQIFADALKLEQAGADMLLLECVPAALAKRITQAVTIPVIGIGAGPDCDGQILVVYDILAISPGKRPRFSKNYLENGRSISGAIGAYIDEVQQQTFPDACHSF